MRKKGEQVRFSRYGGFAFALLGPAEAACFSADGVPAAGAYLAAAQPGAVCGGGGQFPCGKPGHSGAGSPMRQWLLGLPVGGPQRKTKNALLEALPELQWAG